MGSLYPSRRNFGPWYQSLSLSLSFYAYIHNVFSPDGRSSSSSRRSRDMARREEGASLLLLRNLSPVPLRQRLLRGVLSASFSSRSQTFRVNTHQSLGAIKRERQPRDVSSSHICWKVLLLFLPPVCTHRPAISARSLIRYLYLLCAIKSRPALFPDGRDKSGAGSALVYWSNLNKQMECQDSILLKITWNLPTHLLYDSGAGLFTDERRRKHGLGRRTFPYISSFAYILFAWLSVKEDQVPRRHKQARKKGGKTKM